jgi:hypothetical protein
MDTLNYKDHKQLQDNLSKNHTCYVLLTCGEPAEDGTMQIEMTYEGDATVAAYMLQGAQVYMNDQELDSTNSKVEPLQNS